MADWSRGVPNELLYSIFQSLCFHDYGRCHVVCANWNFVAKAYRFRHSRQSPWLMIPLSKFHKQYFTCRVYDDQDGTCSVYDVAHRLEFNISLPPSAPNWTYCIGSSQGWILILDDFGELFMLNPVTGAFFLPPSTTTLPLPCITILPLYYSMYPYKYKMATVGWTSESSYIVMVVHGYLNERISYARSTDTSWHPMETETRFFQYIAFHDNLFYGISYTNQLVCLDQSEYHNDDNGLLEIFDPSYNPPSMIKRITLSTPPQRLLSLYPECTFKRCVANLFGEFFQVDRVFCWEYTGYVFKTCAFEVYRLDNDRQTWLKAKSIGDYSFFVGDNDVIVISAIDFPSIKGNCIYYIDYHCQIGVFSLEDGQITDYDESFEIICQRPIPICMVPHL